MCLFILRVRLHSPQSHKDTGKLYFRFQLLLRGVLRQPSVILLAVLPPTLWSGRTGRSKSHDPFKMT